MHGVSVSESISLQGAPPSPWGRGEGRQTRWAPGRCIGLLLTSDSTAGGQSSASGGPGPPNHNMSGSECQELGIPGGREGAGQ